MVNETNYNELRFDEIRIGLASPEAILSWGEGEVTKPETINYRTLKPEPDGLFCERIFGPIKDYECHCGKYKKRKSVGKVCEKCGVKITRSKVRRENMGYIKLVSPVAHIWYSKATPSKMSLLLGIPPKKLETVIYFQAYVITKIYDDMFFTEYKVGDVITADEKEHLEKKYNLPGLPPVFEAGIGAAAIETMLKDIDLDELSETLNERLETLDAKSQERKKLLNRLEVVEAFRSSGNRPEWMIINVLPVIPPDLRPMVQLDGGRFATLDLNDLYRRIINRNNRLKDLLSKPTVEIMVRNEMRMLQEAVDDLIENGRRGKPVVGANSRPLKSLSDMLKGKQGRFRQNLLGKRVDYSGRSVIVVGPELKMYQCGLPKEMALELFKPFVMKVLVDHNIATNIKSAKKMVDKAGPEVFDALEQVIKDHPVMLNRAPTLHRLGIQAFEPVLVEGRAIKLHPLSCTAFNADFDGDQMAVHVPLSVEAQAEARFLMLASNNLLKPSDGKPVTVPTQDMVLGSYWLTQMKPGVKGEGRAFSGVDEAMMAYLDHELDLHAEIKIRMSKKIDGEMKSKVITTTLGRVIFNEPIPQDLGFVDRSDPEKAFDLEIDHLVKKGDLGDIIYRAIRKKGVYESSVMLDKIKANGYKYSTLSGMTFSVFDAIIPAHKKDYLEEAEKQVDKVNRMFDAGFASPENRVKEMLKIWENCTDRIKKDITVDLKEGNPIFTMVDSGARGSIGQLSQLVGMIGLKQNTAGRTIEVPIRANYREGLNVQEYFISSRGARKGLTDTALRTADSGYLTRRLVDVAHDVVISDYDCGTTEGFEVSVILNREGDRELEPFRERLEGRFLVEPFADPETGEVLIDNLHMLTDEDADLIVSTGVKSVRIRSLLKCRLKTGVCVKCYGKNMATGNTVQVGEAVGIIAAQAIGEPGTQLTMRNFHTGGVVGNADITQGLPRVEELFEARKPKAHALLAKRDGIVYIPEESGKRGREISVHPVIEDEDGKQIELPLPENEKPDRISYDSILAVNNGDFVKRGDALTEGSKYPSDILSIMGTDDPEEGVVAVQNYIINEVQSAYRDQGVKINDKHIEIIVRQMMRKVIVRKRGETDLVEGATVNVSDFNTANEKVLAENGETAVLAEAEPMILGITKSSLQTDSFLSAASFQETTRVLTDAAVKGKSDPLTGLKENVIIGKLLPSGTGLKVYNDVDVEADAEALSYDRGFFENKGSDSVRPAS